jgi:hypothetical protein
MKQSYYSQLRRSSLFGIAAALIGLSFGYLERQHFKAVRALDDQAEALKATQKELDKDRQSSAEQALDLARAEEKLSEKKRYEVEDYASRLESLILGIVVVVMLIWMVLLFLSILNLDNSTTPKNKVVTSTEGNQPPSRVTSQ